MGNNVAIIGMAFSSFAEDHHEALDEIVFDTVYRALDDAAVRKGDLDLSLMASYDLYEGRTISYGMTLPAAAGYLNDEYRFQNDGMSVVINAAAAIAGNNAEVALVTAMHKPEMSRAAGQDTAAFLDQLSNLAFDPHFVRPVGATGTALLAMHAARGLDRPESDTASLARIAAAEINRGSTSARAFRPAASEADVEAAETRCWPLTELMLPAMSSGVVSLILASNARARRARQAHAWIRGSGSGGTTYTWNPQWLLDPAAATRRAAERAYRLAGVLDPSSEIAVAEITALTPALMPSMTSALGLDKLDTARLNPSGGVRSNFPGLANGPLRMIEAITWLRDRPSSDPRLAVTHATDYLLGTAASNSYVTVLEV